MSRFHNTFVLTYLNLTRITSWRDRKVPWNQNNKTVQLWNLRNHSFPPNNYWFHSWGELSPVYAWCWKQRWINRSSTYSHGAHSQCIFKKLTNSCTESKALNIRIFQANTSKCSTGAHAVSILAYSHFIKQYKSLNQKKKGLVGWKH